MYFFICYVIECNVKIKFNVDLFNCLVPRVPSFWEGLELLSYIVRVYSIELLKFIFKLEVRRSHSNDEYVASFNNRFEKTLFDVLRMDLKNIAEGNKFDEAWIITRSVHSGSCATQLRDRIIGLFVRV